MRSSESGTIVVPEAVGDGATRWICEVGAILRFLFVLDDAGTWELTVIWVAN